MGDVGALEPAREAELGGELRHDAARRELQLRDVEGQAEERCAQDEPTPRTRGVDRARRGDETAEAVPEEETSAALRALAHHAGELRRVLEELVEAVAVPAGPRRPPVAAH